MYRLVYLLLTTLPLSQTVVAHGRYHDDYPVEDLDQKKGEEGRGLEVQGAEQNSIIVLEDGVASELVSLNAGEEQFYAYEWEYSDLIGMIRCQSTGPNGNADLVPRWGAFPSWWDDVYDYWWDSGDSNEIFFVGLPSSSLVLYLQLYGVTSASDVSVTCEARPSVILQRSVPSEPLSLLEHDEQYYVYYLQFPETALTVTCETVGPNGDAALYVGWGIYPVHSEDCKSDDYGSTESCTLDILSGATEVHVALFAWETFTDVKVVCYELLPPTFSPTILVSSEPSAVPSPPPSVSTAPSTSAAPSMSCHRRLFQSCEASSECGRGRCSRGRCRLLF